MLLSLFSPAQLHHSKNMLLIPFFRFGAHKTNGFLAPFVIHYLSAVMVFEWAYCLVMIYQPLCTPWMHVIVMCDNKDILNLNLNLNFEFECWDIGIKGVVAVTPDQPWWIPIITWLNNVILHVFTTKYVQKHHQIERRRLLASIVTSRISP